MKAIGNNSVILAALLAIGSFGFCQNSSGQDVFSGINLTVTSLQSGPLAISVTDVAAISSLSNQQLNVLMATLDATPQIACDALPRQGSVGGVLVVATSRMAAVAVRYQPVGGVAD